MDKQENLCSKIPHEIEHKVVVHFVLSSGTRLFKTKHYCKGPCVLSSPASAYFRQNINTTTKQIAPDDEIAKMFVIFQMNW